MIETIFLGAVGILAGGAFLSLKADIKRLGHRVEAIRSTQLEEAQATANRFDWSQSNQRDALAMVRTDLQRKAAGIIDRFYETHPHLREGSEERRAEAERAVNITIDPDQFRNARVQKGGE